MELSGIVLFALSKSKKVTMVLLSLSRTAARRLVSLKASKSPAALVLNRSMASLGDTLGKKVQKKRLRYLSQKSSNCNFFLLMLPRCSRRLRLKKTDTCVNWKTSTLRARRLSRRKKYVSRRLTFSTKLLPLLWLSCTRSCKRLAMMSFLIRLWKRLLDGSWESPKRSRLKRVSSSYYGAVIQYFVSKEQFTAYECHQVGKRQCSC